MIRLGGDSPYVSGVTVEAEDGVGGDDAADCLRYLVGTKSRTATVRKLRGL